MVLCGPMKQRSPMTDRRALHGRLLSSASPTEPSHAHRAVRAVADDADEVGDLRALADAHAAAGLDEVEVADETSSASCRRSSCSMQVEGEMRVPGRRCARQTALR
jgi:hypothetical protein